MKTGMMILAGMILSGSVAFAGVEKFNSDEFNDIIAENLKAEQSLQNELQAGTGVPSTKGNLARKPGKKIVERFDSEGVAESVAAPTTNFVWSKHQDETRKPLMKKDLKRISAEIQELEQ